MNNRPTACFVSPPRADETRKVTEDEANDLLSDEERDAGGENDAYDKPIGARFRDHRHFDVITRMPGHGMILGAEFLAATGGDMSIFGTPDRLAAFGGVAPVPQDSGKISGNLRCPQRYNRRLQRGLYTSALFSIRKCEESRRSTTASVRRANDTPEPSSPSHAAAST